MTNTFLISFLFFASSSTLCLAEDFVPCDVGGIPYDTGKFSLLICTGSLDHDTAIDCVNKLAADADRFKIRSEAAQAQAECLCRSLNAAVGGSGRYDWLTGQCLVSP